MRVGLVTDPQPGCPTSITLDLIVAVDVRWHNYQWSVFARPLQGEPFRVRSFGGATSMGGLPDYPERDKRCKERAEEYARTLSAKIAGYEAIPSNWVPVQL